MKKYIQGFFTAILIFVSSTLYGQSIPNVSTDTSTTKGLLHYILDPIDKSDIPTNFLAAWGAPILPMATFNGTLTDSNRIDMNLWRTLYFQLQTAYCGSSTNPLVPITTVNNEIQQNIGDSLPVPIPLLIGEYNSVKSDAFTNNLLSYNSSENQVHDVAERTQSPYHLNHLFAACPNNNFTTSGIATFVCKPSLVWNNTGKTISNIQIDFANGDGFKTIAMNTPVTVSYSDTGTVRWIIKITLSDNTVLQCYSKYHVWKAVSANARYYRTGWDAIWHIPYNSSLYDGADVYITYTSRNPTNTVRKPLIVVEGYDVSAVAPGLQNNYSDSDFVDAITNEPGIAFDFNYHLDDLAGYDLVFIDFHNGTDDIRRNAALVEHIIDLVNAAKAAAGSSEQNVVMGLSMGGLVARYALAEMTKNNEDPETRLLITHDSPHRGANVPLGIQYLIEMAGHVNLFTYDVRDIYPQYDEALNLLNEPATRQLLLYRATGSTTFVNNTFLDGDYRNMITFNAGDPQPAYRFIATADGSQCGHPLFPPHQRLFYSNDNAFLFLWPLLSYRLRADIRAYALPVTGSTDMIARVSVSSKFKLFGFITISKQVYSSTAYAPGTQLPVDGAAGSTNPLIDVGVPHANVGFLIPPILGIWAAVNLHSGGDPTKFCFVPTASALDIDPFNTAALSAPYVDGYNANFVSRSDAYIAQEGIGGVYNNTHIRFTARNAEWLYDEMEGISNTLNCSSECSPDKNFVIQGNYQLCGSASYSVLGLPKNATVSWSVAPSGIVNTSSNGNQIILTQMVQGSVTLTANINTPCTFNSLQIQKIIQVFNPPNMNLIDIEAKNNPSCITSSSQKMRFGLTYNGVYECGTPIDEIVEVDWQIYSPYPYQLTYGCSSHAGIAMGFAPPNHPFMLTLRARVKNKCGEWSGWTPGYSFQIKSCSPAPFSFTISPNPTSGIINITTHYTDKQYSKNRKSSSDGFVKDVKIYTSSGKLVKQLLFGESSSQVRVDVSSLTPGIYFVKISNEQHTETQKLVVGKHRIIYK